jgi:hypothetical protein
LYIQYDMPKERLEGWPINRFEGKLAQ